MHETHGHSHGSLHLIVGLLGVLLVLETIVFGYVIMQYVDLQNEQESLLDQRSESVADREAEPQNKVPPVVYVDRAGEADELVSISRTKGSEVSIFTNDKVTSIQDVFVPQIGYDETIYFTVVGEGTHPPLRLYSLANTGGQPTKVTLPGDGFEGEFVISQDQTKIAFVPVGIDLQGGTELMVLDLLTQEVSTIGNSGEYVYYQTINEMDTVPSGTVLEWVDRECVSASLFELDETGVSQFISEQVSCIE
jgi:hypothetical protein